MSRIITKSMAVVAAAAMVFTAMFAITPQADAQGYPPTPGFLDLVLIPPFGAADPIQCGGQPYGSIAGGIGPYTITYTLIGPTTVTLPSFSVATQGNFTAPAGTINYATLPDGAYTVRYVIRDSFGQTASGSYSATITDNCDGGADPTPGGGGVVVPGGAPADPYPPRPRLAYTGSDMSLPVTAGAILIGSGGLLLLAANKRSRKQD